MPKKKHRSLVVNFAAGPGAGKSTNSTHLFSELKRRGINAEYASEYAKDVTWREAQSILKDQVYVFAKQRNRLFVLDGQVDVIVTDSPLFLSLAYGEGMSEAFHDFVIEEFHRFENRTYFLERTKPYNPKGRNQNEEEAKEKDQEILAILGDYGIPFEVVPDSRKAIKRIAEGIEKYLTHRG